METKKTRIRKDRFNYLVNKYYNGLDKIKQAACDYIVAALNDHNDKVELCADNNLYVVHKENDCTERSHVDEIFIKDNDQCRIYLRLDTTDTECPICWFEPEEIIRIATYLECNVFIEE